MSQPTLEEVLAVGGACIMITLKRISSHPVVVSYEGHLENRDHCRAERCRQDDVCATVPAQ
jgi:hypothetical protein